MPARVKRVTVASAPTDKVTAGNIRWRSASAAVLHCPASSASRIKDPVMEGGGTMPLDSSPRNGSHSRFIAKIICNVIANQNAATATPVTDTTRNTKSGQQL